MFSRSSGLAWAGILVLSGMFLLGQDTWPPSVCVDSDGDGYGSPAAPTCTYPEPDCDDARADVHPGRVEAPYLGSVCEDGLDNDCDGLADGAERGCVDLGAAWHMHPVGDRFRGANALTPGDVNQDGYTDYVTNYEFDQRYVIVFHPGAGGNVKQPWPAVTAFVPEPLAFGSGVNPENAALGDFDGDGNLDVVGAQGWSSLPFWEGSEPGVRLVWGPPASEALDEEAWTDAGRIPVTIDRGHFIYVRPLDVNGDGLTDIVGGGRVHGGNQRKGGVVWIEAPADPQVRRDLSLWRIHDIDPEQFDAHGLVFADIDADGDQDVALANADFDTPEEEEKVLWYENPGTGDPAQEGPWPIHVIYQGDEFYPKPQLAVADLDGDGLEDLVTQVADAVYVFRKTGVAPVAWERIVIPKDPVAQWLSRPIRVEDINADGKLDLVGMLLHEDTVLPADKAAGFWMEYSGSEPRADNWTTHVIKWGSGKTMALPGFGEKWDQVNFADVDGDGDPDILANCEEWWEDSAEFLFYSNPDMDPNTVAVVWFENRLEESPYAFGEQSGLCVLEAERPSALHDGSWIVRTRFPGFAGDGYLQDPNHLGGAAGWGDTEGVTYTVNLDGGTYGVWLRRLVPGEWGARGGAKSSAAFLGIDGALFCGSIEGGDEPLDAWEWVRIPCPVELPAGTHTLTLRVQEGGFAIDRILLAADPAFTPSGPGPAETLTAP